METLLPFIDIAVTYPGTTATTLLFEDDLEILSNFAFTLE
jgi:hypothetical protein